MSPAEFWELHPDEIWWILDARRPAKMYGKMTEDEVRKIYEEDFGPIEEQ